MEQKFIEELELPTQCILAQKRDFKKIISCQDANTKKRVDSSAIV